MRKIDRLTSEEKGEQNQTDNCKIIIRFEKGGGKFEEVGSNAAIS